jgi:hypothetical protein
MSNLSTRLDALEAVGDPPAAPATRLYLQEPGESVAAFNDRACAEHAGYPDALAIHVVFVSPGSRLEAEGEP